VVCVARIDPAETVISERTCTASGTAGRRERHRLSWLSVVTKIEGVVIKKNEGFDRRNRGPSLDRAA
jgi:hypothetical protein